jgi:SAM-dependent methyltransferase
MNPSPSPAAARESANDRGISASFEAPGWYLERFAANIRIRAETVAALTAGKPVERVLDIGCGDGSLSCQFLARAADVTFLDPSAAMLRRVSARARGRGPALARYVNRGFMEAPLPTAGFDLVLCVGVLAYVADPGPFLAKVCSVLAPGGRLLLECTDASHFLSRLDRAYAGAMALAGRARFETHPHPAGEVLAAAEARGLRLEAVFRYAYGFPVVSRLLSQRGTYRLIRRLFGNVADNRRSRFGNQLLFSLVRS